MKDIFTKAIFHEKLHQSEIKYPEEFVKRVTKGCLEGDRAALENLDKLFDDRNKTAGAAISPAAVTEASRVASQEQTANIPASVAAGDVAPGGGTASNGSQYPRGIDSLNSGFRSIASRGSPDSAGAWNPEESYRASIARTSPVLKAFGLFGVVPAAQASAVPAVAIDGGGKSFEGVSGEASNVRSPASSRQTAKGAKGVDEGPSPGVASGGGRGSSKLSGASQGGGATDSGSNSSAEQADKLLRSIASIKDPDKRKAALESIQRQLEALGAYYYDQDLKQSYGEEVGKADSKYTLIKGKLTKE